MKNLGSNLIQFVFFHVETVKKHNKKNLFSFNICFLPEKARDIENDNFQTTVYLFFNPNNKKPTL